ncbi:MAG TPA: hypothetical protein VE641_19700 [Chthoniobacterales bacterium]|nr:hypothetical protein [Chthoniobacterales bacterium]
MNQPLSGEAIATFAKRVWAGSSDFSVELVSTGEIGEGLVAFQPKIRSSAA